MGLCLHLQLRKFWLFCLPPFCHAPMPYLLVSKITPTTKGRGNDFGHFLFYQLSDGNEAIVPTLSSQKSAEMTIKDQKRPDSG